MSFIKSRLRRIEQTARSGPCPECQLPPDGPGYIVYAGEAGAAARDEFCARCGRPLWFVIEVAGEGMLAIE